MRCTRKGCEYEAEIQAVDGYDTINLCAWCFQDRIWHYADDSAYFHADISDHVPGNGHRYETGIDPTFRYCPACGDAVKE